MASIHDDDAVEAFRRRHRLDPQRIKRFRNAFYKARRSAEDAVMELPPPVRDDASNSFAFHTLELESAHDSRDDGATKLIFRTADGLRIESVILRIKTGRTSLCISSQVGCRAACSFCATGRMGIQRDLTPDEIVDQVLLANRRLEAEGRSVRNIVFMGMGEPLHNPTALHAALDALSSPHRFHHPPSRILVSTVGVPHEMRRLPRLFPDVRLALSLHAASQDVRERIVPLARRHHVDELRDVVAEVATPGREVMIEYILLAGINDRDEDVGALLAWCDGLPVHINLIPYNAIDGVELTGTPSARSAEIARSLRAQSGLPVTTRYSLGADIAAACGQLVRRENRRPRRHSKKKSPADPAEVGERPPAS